MVPIVRGPQAGKLREEMASPGGFRADTKGAQAGGEGAGLMADVPSTRKCSIVPLNPFKCPRVSGAPVRFQSTKGQMFRTEVAGHFPNDCSYSKKSNQSSFSYTFYSLIGTILK